MTVIFNEYLTALFFFAITRFHMFIHMYLHILTSIYVYVCVPPSTIHMCMLSATMVGFFVFAVAVHSQPILRTIITTTIGYYYS